MLPVLVMTRVLNVLSAATGPSRQSGDLLTDLAAYRAER